MKNMNNKGFAGLLYLVLTIVVGMILVMVVAIPVTKTAITSANLSGTDATVANSIPTFLVIGGLVLAAGLALAGFIGGKK